MAEINGALLCHAKVMHKRLQSKVNQFTYKVFYLCFDIAKTAKLQSKFLSVNRFNLFSFYNRDHGKRDKSSLESWIQEILRSKNLNEKVTQIFLLTHPRVLGHVFNPVSFWFCLDVKKNLIAVLCEVNNTFGENHNYLICNKDHAPIEQNQWFESNKDFHVSPFFQRTGKYQFRFFFDEKSIAADINYFCDGAQKSLITTLRSKNEKLSDSLLIKAFCNIPLMTLKVIFLIHYQALKLVIKGIKYVPQPQKKTFNLTQNHE